MSMMLRPQVHRPIASSKFQGNIKHYQRLLLCIVMKLSNKKMTKSCSALCRLISLIVRLGIWDESRNWMIFEMSSEFTVQEFNPKTSVHIQL